MKKIIAAAILATSIVVAGSAWAMGMGYDNSSMMNSQGGSGSMMSGSQTTGMMHGSGNNSMMNNMQMDMNYGSKAHETRQNNDGVQKKSEKNYVYGEFRANLSEKERKALEHEERYGK